MVRMCRQYGDHTGDSVHTCTFEEEGEKEGDDELEFVESESKVRGEV